MLTREENEMLTRVGPGTPCGELMGRYWHPVAATVQLEDNPVRKVRILGEDLVLYCPDRELILKLYEEADRLMQQKAPAR
jgi:hypothetical protein